MSDLSFPSFSLGSRFLDVSKFGALGEGADESAAISAAIAALPSSGANQGGTLFFPGRFYRFNTGIVTAVNNLEFVGMGGRGQSRGLGGSPTFMGRTTFVVPDGITALTWGTSGSFLARGPVFRNIHWTAEAASAAADTSALLMYQPSNYLVDNCSFSGFNWSIGPATITGISAYAAGAVTVTTSAAHGFSAGQLVQIKSVVNSPVRPNGINACFRVESVPLTTTFTIKMAQDPGTYASGGTACVLGVAVAMKKSSGVTATSSATSYGDFRSCTFASANGMGGMWLDFMNGVNVDNCLFDGGNNNIPIPTNSAALAITGGDNHRITNTRFQSYQTIIDISAGDSHVMIGNRYEAFGIGVNCHADSCSDIGGGYTNSGAGGVGINFGPGGTNLTFQPAAMRGTGKRYTCQDATAGASFRDVVGGLQIATLLANDTTQTSTTKSITGVKIAIGASATEIWQFKLMLHFTGSNVTSDVKIGLGTMPTSATMRWGASGQGGGAVVGYGAVVPGSTPTTIGTESATIPMGSAGASFGYIYEGQIYGGGTAGNVQFLWGQNTTDANDLTLLAGSSVQAWRIQP